MGQKIRWRSSNLKSCDGHLIACDEKQEWLLPWWWSNFHQHNEYPVTFVDLGMSEAAINWCRSKGELVSLPSRDVSFSHPWFKKPLALLETPYQRTIWTDLDCEVLGPLSPLFQECDNIEKIALAKEPSYQQEAFFKKGMLKDNEVVYNSGVIVYKRSCDLILKWAEETLIDHENYFGDENILSRLIYNQKIQINELSSIYNWRILLGLPLSAIIIHWVGDWGKEYIKKYGGLRSDLNHHFVEKMR